MTHWQSSFLELVQHLIVNEARPFGRRLCLYLQTRTAQIFVSVYCINKCTVLFIQILKTYLRHSPVQVYHLHGAQNASVQLISSDKLFFKRFFSLARLRCWCRSYIKRMVAAINSVHWSKKCMAWTTLILQILSKGSNGNRSKHINGCTTQTNRAEFTSRSSGEV